MQSIFEMRMAIVLAVFAFASCAKQSVSLEEQLDRAVRAGDVKALKQVLDEADPKRQAPALVRDAIALGASLGKLPIITSFRDLGYDLNYTNSDGWPPLMSAVLGTNSEVIKILINARNDPNYRNAQGWTPLTKAIWTDRGDKIDVVKALLAGGADPNLSTGNGRPPLALAVWLARSNLVLALLESGARTNSIDTTTGQPALESFGTERNKMRMFINTITTKSNNSPTGQQ